jgi:hypothetical protein
MFKGFDDLDGSCPVRPRPCSPSPVVERFDERTPSVQRFAHLANVANLTSQLNLIFAWQRARPRPRRVQYSAYLSGFVEFDQSGEYATQIASGIEHRVGLGRTEPQCLGPTGDTDLAVFIQRLAVARQLDGTVLGVSRQVDGTGVSPGR